MSSVKCSEKKIDIGFSPPSTDTCNTCTIFTINIAQLKNLAPGIKRYKRWKLSFVSIRRFQGRVEGHWTALLALQASL